MPGAPVFGAPEAAVSAYRFWPLGSRPAGLTKLASWIWPTVCGCAWPGSATLTVPSLPIVTLCALAGIVMPGCSG